MNFYTIILIMVIILGALLLFSLADYFLQNNAIIADAKKQAMINTADATHRMEENFTKLKKIADEQAHIMESSHFSKQELENTVFDVMEKNQEVFGFCIAYKPNMYEKDLSLFAPYCDRKDGVIRRMHVEDIYDYTKENTSGLNWFIKPLQQGAGWTEPYFGSASSSLLSVYSIPFYGVSPVTGNREIVGIVSIVYSLDDIEKYINMLDFRGRGYAYLLSKKGTYISHPVSENVVGQRKIGSASDGISKQIAELLVSENNQIFEFINDITGQESWVLHQTVPSTGYSLGAVFIKNAMVNNLDFSRHRLIIICFLAIIVLSLLIILICKRYSFSEKRLWSISIAISILLVIGISFIWFLALKYDSYSNNGIVKIIDESSLQGFLNEKNGLSHINQEDKPVLIPTGIFIQSLEFESSNNVRLTGYVWQKYTNDIPETISRGFIMPEAISFSVEDAYEKDSGNVKTLGWRFDAVLRQPFDYKKYPLDNKDVWIKILHKDIGKNIILVPDLNSYELTNPNCLPGIEKNIVLSGWDIKQSFFSYISNSYNADFGIDGFSNQEKFQELHFITVITRKFMNPFISYLLPFIVMAFMLFGTLALIYIIEEKAKKFDFSVASVLAACAALFFSVIITHNSLRDSISSNGILYLEYFYFILYAAIIMVIIDAFLVAFKNDSWLVTYKDNIIPKIVFWPSLLSVILMITICIFY